MESVYFRIDLQYIEILKGENTEIKGTGIQESDPKNRSQQDRLLIQFTMIKCELVKNRQPFRMELICYRWCR